MIASLGLTTLIMQDGVFHISEGSQIIAFLPVIMIGIVFGRANWVFPGANYYNKFKDDAQ